MLRDFSVIRPDLFSQNWKTEERDGSQSVIKPRRAIEKAPGQGAKGGMPNLVYRCDASTADAGMVSLELHALNLLAKFSTAFDGTLFLDS